MQTPSVSSACCTTPLCVQLQVAIAAHLGDAMTQSYLDKLFTITEELMTPSNPVSSSPSLRDLAALVPWLAEATGMASLLGFDDYIQGSQVRVPVTLPWMGTPGLHARCNTIVPVRACNSTPLFTNWYSSYADNRPADVREDASILAGLYGMHSPYKNLRAVMLAILGFYDKFYPSFRKQVTLPFGFPAKHKERAGAWNIVTAFAMYMYYDVFEPMPAPHGRYAPYHVVIADTIPAYYVRPMHARAVAHAQRLRMQPADDEGEDDDDSMDIDTAATLLKSIKTRSARKRSLREEGLLRKCTMDDRRRRKSPFKSAPVASLANRGDNDDEIIIIDDCA